MSNEPYVGYYASVNNGVVLFYHSLVNSSSIIPSDAIQVTDDQFSQAMEVDRSLVSIQNNQLVVTQPTPLDAQTQLKNTQASKVAQLKTSRDANIEQGFSSTTTGHSYYYSKDDQLDFVKQMVKVMNDSTMTSVNWLTKDAGIVSHTRDQYLSLQNDAENWEQKNFIQYQNLESQVLACTTIDQVNVISWTQITN